MEDQFISIIKESQETFYKFAYSYVKNESDALEVISEATYKSLNSLNNLREPTHMKTCFYRIMINECKMCLRKRKVTIVDINKVDNLSSQIEDDYIDLYNAIEKLDIEDKTMVKLKYLENLKLKEISEVMGFNVNTVKTRLRRSIRKLRILIEDDFYE